MSQNRENANRAQAPSPDLFCGIGCFWDLCDQYQAWTVKEGLIELSCAAEHVQDESLTEEQRAWLRGFVERCEMAERWEAELCSRLSLDEPKRLRQFSVRLDDSSESPLLSFAMANNDHPEIMEALFQANFATVELDVGVGQIRKARLVGRVANEADWCCICGNVPDAEGSAEFSASDAHGTLQIGEDGRPTVEWDGRHCRCNSCGAYFDQTDLVVVGRAV